MYICVDYTIILKSLKKIHEKIYLLNYIYIYKT